MDTATPEITENVRTIKRLFSLAHLVSLLTLMLTCGGGGHLGLIALPTSVLGLGLACCGYIKKQKLMKWTRWVFAIFLVIPTLVFLKNVADILWFGHDAMFPLY
jgi:hypothetical protein